MDDKDPAVTSGGESQGGAYPNPHTGKPKPIGGFMGHGGQSEQDYSGTGGGGDESADNDNAATGSGS